MTNNNNNAVPAAVADIETQQGIGVQNPKPSAMTPEKAEEIARTRRDSLLKYAKGYWQHLQIVCVNTPPVLDEATGKYRPSKGPRRKNWSISPPSLEELSEDLVGAVNGVPENLIAVCGQPSKGLVVVDVDSASAGEAWAIISRHYNLETRVRACRESQPKRGHWYYRCQERVGSRSFRSPGSPETPTETFFDLLAEGRGAMTAPSIHPVTGEPVRFHAEKGCNIPVVNPDLLLKAVSMSSAAAMLGKTWSQHKGERNELTMALAGACARSGYSLDVTLALVRAICCVGKDEEFDNRSSAVKKTYEKVGQGEKTTGFNRLQEMLPEGVRKKLAEWLHLVTKDETPSEVETSESVDWHPVDLATWLREPAPDYEYIFQDVLPKGIVAALAAPGGKGKSMLALQLCVSAAIGKTILPSFTPSGPMKVMALLGEDAEEITRRRLHSMAQLYVLTTDEERLLNENLFLFPHQSEALMVKKRDALEQTPRCRWLRKFVHEHEIQLLVLDPKARWAILEENSNDQATAFVTCLEEIVKPIGGTVLITHHIRKESANSGSASGVRGASAFVDSSRLVITMVTPKKKSGDAVLNSANDDQSYIELRISKANYTASPPRPILLRHRRDYDGVFEQMIDRQMDMAEELANALFENLQENGPMKVNGIKDPRTDDEKSLRNNLKAKLDNYRASIDDALEHGQRVGILEVYSGERSPSGGRSATMVRAVTPQDVQSFGEVESEPPSDPADYASYMSN